MTDRVDSWKVPFDQWLVLVCQGTKTGIHIFKMDRHKVVSYIWEDMQKYGRVLFVFSSYL